MAPVSSTSSSPVAPASSQVEGASSPKPESESSGVQDAGSSGDCKAMKRSLHEVGSEVGDLAREIARMRSSGLRQGIGSLLANSLPALTAKLEQIIKLLRVEADIHQQLMNLRCRTGAPAPRSEPEPVPVQAAEPTSDEAIRYLPLWLPPVLLTHPEIREAIAHASQGARAASGTLGVATTRSGISVFFSRLAIGMSTAAGALFLIPDSMLEMDMDLMENPKTSHEGLY